MADKRGKRPSAKEVAKETGLDIEDAKAILSEIPPVKKQKTAPGGSHAAADGSAEPAPREEPAAPEEAAASAEPAAPSEPPAPAETAMLAFEETQVDPAAAETQLDELLATVEPPKEETKVKTAKSEASPRAEDALSEAPTRKCEKPEKPALSPPDEKQVSNAEALKGLGRATTQR